MRKRPSTAVEAARSELEEAPAVWQLAERESAPESASASEQEPELGSASAWELASVSVSALELELESELAAVAAVAAQGPALERDLAAESWLPRVFGATPSCRFGHSSCRRECRPCRRYS